MLNDNLAAFNWIDILMGCIIVRGVFIGISKGLVTELFKLVGMFFTTLITLHYYVAYAGFLHKYILVPDTVNRFIAFILLWVIIVVAFKIFRDGWMMMVKSQAYPLVDKIGGVSLALVRSALICGMTFVLIFVGNNSYLVKSARKSFSGQYFIALSPQLYQACFDKAISKVFKGEKINKEVFKLKDIPQEKEK